MLYGIELSGTGTQIERARLENISNNLANLQTAGFKADLLTYMQRPPESRTVLAPWQAERLFYRNDLLDRIGGGVQLNRSHVVQTVGPLEHTGNSYDVALTGSRGFFQVEDTISGNKFYTRAGGFKANGDGWLLTADGLHYVLDSKGERINIRKVVEDNAGVDFAINDDGMVQVQQAGGGSILTGNTLGVVVFDEKDLPKLRKIGHTLFTTDNETVARSRQLTELSAAERANATRVRQQFLEMSGANPIEAMVDMIEASRAYERNMSLLKMQSSSIEQLINQVGRI